MPRFSAVSRYAFHSLFLSTWPIRAMFSRAIPCALCLLFLSCFSVMVRAQSATAVLSGKVTDETGAVISGVNIAVINIAQNFQRSTTTNDEGIFVVASLPPGSYAVKAEHNGFTTIELKDVVLNVNDQRVIKISLKVGNISQTVEIVDSSSLIDESATVATTVDRQFVANLPLNGRSFQSLINLTPGIVLTKTIVQDQGQFSANGQRADANYFTVDGVSANIGASASTQPSASGAGALPGLSAAGGTNNLVSVDALQEFKVQTSTYAPEFGRTPGAQVSIVTRSGTHEFRGSVFDYFRNDVFDANDWFANRQGLAKPAVRQNDFGGVLGGPLYLPRFGEGGPAVWDKTQSFFFFSYEGLRLRQPQVGISDVPSLAARQAASAAVRPYMDLYPRPNGPARADNLAPFSASFSNPSTLDAASIRIDTHASSKLILFGRYNYSPSQMILRGGTTQTLNSLTNFSVKTHTLTLGGMYILSPSVTNDLRFNYSRNFASSIGEVDNFGGAIISPVAFPAGKSPEDSFFNVNIIGARLGGLFWGRQSSSVQRQFNLVESLSIVRGNHQLKLGLDYRRLLPIFNSPAYLQQFVFSSVGSLVSPAQGSFLSGRPIITAVGSVESSQQAIFNNFSAYAQDSWKLTPRLTLTYGLRWELNPPPHEANGKSPLTLTQVDNPATFAFAPAGTPLWKTTYDNFAPRVGVSYQLSAAPGRETVLRGGFGLFYDMGNAQASNAFIAAYPFTLSRTLSFAPIPLSASDAAPPPLGPSPSTLDTFYAFDPELQLPRVYQWNFAVEQSLGASQSLSASYVAAAGRRLLRIMGITNPNANLRGNFQVTRNTATSDYHAMQLQFQRRLTRGVQALASYSWAHSIDIASSDQQPGTSALLVDPRTDRGPSNFDVRHAFNAAVTYNLPSPQMNRLANAILSRWSIDGIFTARSATPVNVTYSAVVPGIGQIGLRPDLVEGIPLYLDDPNAPGGKRFNNTQTIVPGLPLPQIGPFRRPSPPRQGSLGRNSLRGFPIWQWDLAVRRQFNLTEQRNIQFRAEFFNFLNHPNFGDPLGTLTSANFGLSQTMLGRSLGVGGLQGGFNPLYQVGGPRSMQFSLKLQF